VHGRGRCGRRLRDEPLLSGRPMLQHFATPRLPVSTLRSFRSTNKQSALQHISAWETRFWTLDTQQHTPQCPSAPMQGVREGGRKDGGGGRTLRQRCPRRSCRRSPSSPATATPPSNAGQRKSPSRRSVEVNGRGCLAMTMFVRVCCRDVAAKYAVRLRFDAGSWWSKGTNAGKPGGPTSNSRARCSRQGNQVQV
jgi:hypothetical protein